MAGNKTGAEKVAAIFCGLSVEEYRFRRASGLKRCTKCKQWKSVEHFYPAKERGDGLAADCKDCSYKRTTTGSPGVRERRQRKKLGLVWCRSCKDWVGEKDCWPSVRGLCAEHAKEFSRKNYRKNPEPAKRAAEIRRQKSKPIPKRDRRYLIALFNGKCAYCEQQDWKEWDHVTPLSVGGKGKVGNIVPACQTCNRSKRNLSLPVWLRRNGIQMSQKLKDYLKQTAKHVQFAGRFTYLTNVLRGENNPCSKLNGEQVKEVRARGVAFVGELSKKFKVCRTTIYRVLANNTYK